MTSVLLFVVSVTCGWTISQITLNIAKEGNRLRAALILASFVGAVIVAMVQP